MHDEQHIHMFVQPPSPQEENCPPENPNNQAPSNYQESPAIAGKPARRENLPKIAPIRRAYNVVADNTGLSSFV